jgi:hypothetical protein
MAQGKSQDNVSVTQVLQLIEKMTDEDRQELYRRLDLKSWGEAWRALCAKVDEQTRDLPQLTEAEIVAEMKAIRAELKEERAQSGN